MSAREIVLSITMKSDWGVGAGAARQGTVDRLIRKDSRGFPVIPASTLRGIWRDAAERLAFALDDGVEGGTWSETVVALFGSQPVIESRSPSATRRAPVPSRLSAAPAQMSGPLAEMLARKGDAELRAALFFVKPGVAIDETSGAAAAEQLRFDEMARSDVRLEARCSVDVENINANVATSFLVAAASLIEELGGKRRRGAGRCTVTASCGAVDAKAAVKTLRTAAAISVDDDQEAPMAENTAYRAAGEGGWARVRLDVTAEEPLYFPSSIRGNVTSARDEIPGAVLLPRLQAALEACGVPKGEARSAIAAGDARVSDATLSVAGERGLPVPRCWSAPKASDGSLGLLNDLFRAPEPGRKPLLRSFVAPGAQLAAKVEREIFTQNTVDDAYGKPTENVGGVYTCEALRARQTFVALVEIRMDLLSAWGASIADLTQRLAGSARLSRSSGSGFGKVALAASHAEPDPAPSEHAGGVLVWAVSDILLRPDIRGPWRDPVTLLAEAIGLKTDADANPPKAFLATDRVEGWHRPSGLPRASQVVIAAGSVVLFAGVASDQADLARLQAEGVGERRAEGFGRILINHRAVTDAQVAPQIEGVDQSGADLVDVSASRIASARMSSEDQTLAKAIERAAWRASIARRAELASLRRSDWLHLDARKPSMSQLGALRAAMADFDREEDRDRAAKWVQAVKREQRTREAWPGATLDALDELFARDGERVWGVLSAQGDAEPATLVSDQAALRKEMALEATRALIAIAIQTETRARERGDAQGVA